MKLKLLEAWSKRYTGRLDFDLPDGWQLATHQKEVYDALQDPDVDVVFDTAMTGDGKTLEAILPAVYHRSILDKAIFAYPTNELIRDQFDQFGKWEKRLGFQCRRQALDSQNLTDYAEALKTVAALVPTDQAKASLVHRQDSYPLALTALEQFSFQLVSKVSLKSSCISASAFSWR